MEIHDILGQPRTAISIPCCLCGTLILPNAANQCGACLAQQFDLKAILSKGPAGGNLHVFQCRQCRRYQHTDTYFVNHEPESPSLLALCLKNVPALSSTHSHRNNGLSNLTLVDSMWIWTEPHSMRLKIRLTVRAEVGESPRCVAVQQRLPIEFHVQWKQCRDCNREYTNRTWQALVQLRQKRQDESKKALLMLEAALARNDDIRKHVLSVETSRNGFDFYFMELMHARSFSAFLSSVYPMKIKTNQKLVSEDSKNNSANIKYTTVCDMVPLNRHDLIVCDKRAAKEGCSAGRLNGRMCLVNKLSSSLQLVDAAPARIGIEDCFTSLHHEKYWKGEKYFRLILSMNRLVRFVVMDVELCDSYGPSYHNHFENGNDDHKKYALADVIVAREMDIGVSDDTFHCTTHLGKFLNIGDHVFGYDLVSSVLTGGDEWSIDNSFNSSFTMPDVVLVKKVKARSLEDINHDKNPEKKKKAGSSTSKRREKRLRKQEKKEKKFTETLNRMGFGKKNDHEQIWDEQRKAFEEDLTEDTDLAAEFHEMLGDNSESVNLCCDLPEESTKNDNYNSDNA